MENLRILQTKILEIAIDFDSFCQKNDIKYYMMGGSALGAIRHNGFIPWDDDFDVFMDIENYNKFQRLSKVNFDKIKYHIQYQDTIEWPMFFSKIRLNNSTYIEEDSRNIKTFHQGIFIDLMCLHNTSNFFPLRYIQYISAKVLSTFTLSKTGYITKSRFKKLIILLVRPVNIKFVKKILYKIVCINDHKSTKYVAHWFGRAKYNKCYFNTSLLGNPCYTKFESTTLPVMENVEQYLRIRFGEKFMEIPSEKVKSQFKSHAYIWDINRNYDEFL